MLLALVLAAFSTAFTEGPVCDAPAWSEDAVREIIAKARASRSDLPKAFEHSRWSTRRDGCYTTAIEYSVPEMIHATHIFKLNRRGVIVDVQVGDSLKSDFQCPDEVLTEPELARIVAAARAARRDLPPPFPRARVRVDRMRCIYLYFEYRVPEARGDYHVFLVDPLGELMEFQRSEPY